MPKIRAAAYVPLGLQSRMPSALLSWKDGYNDFVKSAVLSNGTMAYRGLIQGEAAARSNERRPKVAKYMRSCCVTVLS